MGHLSGGVLKHICILLPPRNPRAPEGKDPSLFSSSPSTAVTVTGLVEHTRHILAPGPLHMLFPPHTPGMICQIGLVPSPSSGLCSDVASSEDFPSPAYTSPPRPLSVSEPQSPAGMFYTHIH